MGVTVENAAESSAVRVYLIEWARDHRGSSRGSRAGQCPTPDVASMNAATFCLNRASAGTCT